MNRVIFLLGGNSGDRFVNLFQAILEMSKEFGRPVKSSSFYLTEPWGKKDQPWFLNFSIEFNVPYPPVETLEKALAIEKKMGRERTEKWGPRNLDIDVLYHGESILFSEKMTLPHPGIESRRFVLMPLVQMCPEFIHPVLKKSHRELLHANQAVEAVKRL